MTRAAARTAEPATVPSAPALVLQGSPRRAQCVQGLDITLRILRASADHPGRMSGRQSTLSLVAGAVLIVAGTGAVLTSQTADWSQLSLLGLLFVLAAGSELLGFELRGLRVSGSFPAFVLA